MMETYNPIFTITPEILSFAYEITGVNAGAKPSKFKKKYWR
jgi:hypothetical protein